MKTEQRDRPKKASDTPVHVTAGENMAGCEESEELDQRTFSVVSQQTSTCLAACVSTPEGLPRGSGRAPPPFFKG